VAQAEKGGVAVLEIKGAAVRRGKKAVLHGVSLAVPRGQMAGVLGLNGAGKTTLIKAILGFCPPAAGTIEVAGRPILPMRAAERARLLAYVPQNSQEGIRFPVEDFVSMGMTAYLGPFSRPRRADAERAKEILETLGCGRLAGCRMDKISGGERRMAYLARAVMQDAPWLLLDEPAASLDFSRQHTFLARLRGYVHGKGKGCLMTIHDPELAYAYCDRLIFLHRGSVAADIAVGQQEELAEALRAVYGGQVTADFRDGRLLMGWDGKNFEK